MNKEHVFFLFSLCDSVVQLSIVYKKRTLFLSPCHARANERDSHSKRAISQAQRASPRVQRSRAIFSFSFLSVCLHHSLLFAANHALFLFPSKWDFYFASWFSFSVEAIHYFKGHCFYDIDYFAKKGVLISAISFSPSPSLSLSLSLLSFVHSLIHSFTLRIIKVKQFVVCVNLSNDATSSVFYFYLCWFLIALSLPSTHSLFFLFAFFTLFCSAVLFFLPLLG